MSLTLFSIVKNGLATGTVSGYIQMFYCTCPVESASLIINNINFVAAFVGPETVGTFDLYKMAFFSNNINLPLGSAETITIVLKGATDGAAVLYTCN